MATETIRVLASEVRSGDTFLGQEVDDVFESTSYVPAPDENNNTPLILVSLSGFGYLYLRSDTDVTVEREKPVDPPNTIRRNAATGQVFRKHPDGAWYKTGQEYSYFPGQIEVEGFDVIWSPEGD